MDNLLKAQQSLEEVEASIAKYVCKETIKVAHVQFLSRISSSRSEALYLLAIGQPAVHPLSSHLEFAHIKSAQKSSVGRRFSRVATCSGDNQG